MTRPNGPDGPGEAGMVPEDVPRRSRAETGADDELTDEERDRAIGDLHRRRAELAVPASCPTCGVNQVRAVAYGYPPSGADGEAVEVEGVTWGGCVADPAAPEWRCSNGHEWRTTPAYPELPPPDGDWERALAELDVWRRAFEGR